MPLPTRIYRQPLKGAPKSKQARNYIRPLRSKSELHNIPQVIMRWNYSAVLYLAEIAQVAWMAVYYTVCMANHLISNGQPSSIRLSFSLIRLLIEQCHGQLSTEVILLIGGTHPLIRVFAKQIGMNDEIEGTQGGRSIPVPCTDPPPEGPCRRPS